MIDGLPTGKGFRKQTPLNPTLENVKNGVNNNPAVYRRSPDLVRSRKLLLE